MLSTGSHWAHNLSLVDCAGGLPPSVVAIPMAPCAAVFTPSPISSAPMPARRVSRRRDIDGWALKVAAMNRRGSERLRRCGHDHGEAADVAIGARHASKVRELGDRHHAKWRLAGNRSRGIEGCHRSCGSEHEGGNLRFHDSSPGWWTVQSLRTGTPTDAEAHFGNSGRNGGGRIRTHRAWSLCTLPMGN